ncbi:MAG: GMC family oxidoreductase N-terminal domain-containing protein [Gammaproteobacteria bacterium]|nr:GMC family oxidoreductase N-terminal domain-containing protein [Gammaproteobacteria bacterium]
MRPASAEMATSHTCDFIVVGAGSAGCVLANRLSSNGKFNVLVLEAGPHDRKFWVQVPIGYGKTFYDRKVNWAYLTEPEAGLNNRVSYWPRGKITGGSSSINAMVYIRGQKEDYNAWRDMGNPDWGWNDVLPYFKKAETNSRGGDAYRGDSGPLYVNDASEHYHALCKTFIAAANEYGLPCNPDFNGASQEGAGLYQITTKDGLRMSASRAYLRPAAKRKNCMVETGAHVTRILFENNRAIGVEYVKKGRVVRALAHREVILSGGAINSPQLLQLSGIGPEKLLREHGIPVLCGNDAVGQNLQDHLAYTHYYRSKVPTLNNQLAPWWGKLWAGMQYLLFRQGPLSLSVNQAGGFFRSSPGRTSPNLQIYFAALTYVTSPPGERPLMRPDPYPAFQNAFSQCRPTSKGHLQIRSNDPFTHPRIQPNYLSTEQDIQEMVEGFEFLRSLSQTRALSGVLEEEMTPGPAVHSATEIIEDIRNRSETVYHPTSTCRMGPDPQSFVVDSSLKVHGANGLRVVDASVFPVIVSGNTNAPVIMVAEKASDLILQDAQATSRRAGRRVDTAAIPTHKSA